MTAIEVRELVRQGAVVAIVACAILLFILGLPGCASAGPYRAPTYPKPPVSQLPTTEDHSQEGYRLGFVEFDDQGWFYTPGRDQLREVESMVASASNLASASPTPIILVAYVHGWKNNASEDPGNNAIDFRQEMQRIAAMERQSSAALKQTARPVVGVYIGWPGLSATFEPFKELSFYARKNTGDRVGNYGGVTEVLTRLEALNNEINRPGHAKAEAITKEQAGRRSYFIVVGHSFGAQVVYNSLLPIMTENLSKFQNR